MSPSDPTEPFDLEKIARLTGGELDELPFGVVVVDREGIILEYNTYEREMASMGTRKLIGLNFFHDVAPCTAIQEFEGRYAAFLDSDDRTIEPFEFVFPFRTGYQVVNVIFTRTSNDADRAMICIVRRDLREPAPSWTSTRT
jgi:photoactive yellow protein